MNDAERALAKVAATQRQVFTRAQAVAAGLSPNGVSRRVANGLFGGSIVTGWVHAALL
jgi:hypothetical protein